MMLAAWLWMGCSLTEVKRSAASHEGEEYPICGHALASSVGSESPVEAGIDYIFPGEQVAGEARVQWA